MSSEPEAAQLPVAHARASRVQSVDRAMTLLRALADAPPVECTAALLAERTNLNRATAWRMLSTLEMHGMVFCDRATGQWSIGMGVVEVARAAGLDAIIRSAHKVLEHLSLVTGETAALAVTGSAGLSYVDEVQPGPVPTISWIGRSVPLHATSTGKVLLAFSEPEDVRRLVGSRLERFTGNTITVRSALLLELVRVRERGYAECHGELEQATWGVSAPITDGGRRAVAVLSVWGPEDRVSDARFDALGALAKDAAQTLSRR